MSLPLPKPVRQVKARKPIARRSRPRRNRRGEAARIKRECDRLWSLIVRARGECEAPPDPEVISGWPEHRGALQAAHGFSRRYRGTRWMPMNGFALCASHHLTYTYDPLAWDSYLRRAWGELVYQEMRRHAQRGRKQDMEAVLGSLVREAEQRGIR